MSLPIVTGGIRHVALRVRDVARSKTFYADIFGMHPVWEPDAENCYLSSGCDNLALHAVSEGAIAPPEQQMLDHIGFIVSTPEAVWAAAETLRARHVPIVKEPRRHRDGSCSLYCSDPDGTLIQSLFEPSISPQTIR